MYFVYCQNLKIDPNAALAVVLLFVLSRYDSKNIIRVLRTKCFVKFEILEIGQ
jgi:hypothetical protein